jgi:hypothetical protein
MRTISLAFVFLTSLFGYSVNAQNSVALTEKAILRTLKELKGGDWHPDRVCIERSEPAAKLVVIGIKDNDLVCRLDGAFVDRNYFQKGSPEWPANALRSLGWAKDDQQTRVRFAVLWVEKVLFAFSLKPDRVFHGAAIADNQVRVVASIQLAPGITSRNAPEIIIFDRDGNILPTRGQ